MARFFAALVLALMGLQAEAFVAPRALKALSPLSALKMPSYDLAKDKNLDLVFQRNKDYVEKVTKDDPGFFKNFGNGQAPQILWIGCADSRVPETQLMGLDVGDVFVTRNVANVVSHMDNSMMSVLQYAVEALKVKHIIVCGHYKCGGVVASTQNVDHTPPLSQWVRNIRETQRLHADELRVSQRLEVIWFSLILIL